MQRLTNHEIDILVEAVDVWKDKNKPDVGLQLLGAAMSKKSPDELKVEMKQQEEDFKQRNKVNFEMAIVIQSKLIQLKQGVLDKEEVSKS
jgi:hypothetical protein